MYVSPKPCQMISGSLEESDDGEGARGCCEGRAMTEGARAM